MRKLPEVGERYGEDGVVVASEWRRETEYDDKYVLFLLNYGRYRVLVSDGYIIWQDTTYLSSQAAFKAFNELWEV